MKSEGEPERKKVSKLSDLRVEDVVELATVEGWTANEISGLLATTSPNGSASDEFGLAQNKLRELLKKHQVITAGNKDLTRRRDIALSLITSTSPKEALADAQRKYGTISGLHGSNISRDFLSFVGLLFMLEHDKTHPELEQAEVARAKILRQRTSVSDAEYLMSATRKGSRGIDGTIGDPATEGDAKLASKKGAALAKNSAKSGTKKLSRKPSPPLTREAMDSLPVIDPEQLEQIAKIILGYQNDEEGSWQEQALCAQTDPDAFFPEKGGSTREAKRVCASCEVRSECLEYALSNEERFGIWGGLSERERRKLKKLAV